MSRKIEGGGVRKDEGWSATSHEEVAYVSCELAQQWIGILLSLPSSQRSPTRMTALLHLVQSELSNAMRSLEVWKNTCENQSLSFGEQNGKQERRDS